MPAFCVFSAHTSLLGHVPILGGDTAVELFFAVSGFYMQMVLSAKYNRERLGNSWAMQFYKARYLRLLPTYLAAVLLTILTASVLHNPFLDVWRYVLGLNNTFQNLLFKAYFVVTNLTIVFQDLTMFLASHGGQIHWSAQFADSDTALWRGLAVSQAWSLGTELSFYFLAPFLLRLRSGWLAAGVGCCLVSKAAFLVLTRLHDPWTYRFFPFELCYFLAGALACRYRDKLTPRIPKRLGQLLVYPLACLVIVAPLPFGLKLIYPMVLAICLPLMFQITAANKTDRTIGDLSYPFYVFHVLALEIAAEMHRHGLISPDAVTWAGLAIAVLLAGGALNLELRFLKPWRARFSVGEGGGRPAAVLNSVSGGGPAAR